MTGDRWQFIEAVIDADFRLWMDDFNDFLESFRIPAANTPVYFRFTE